MPDLALSKGLILDPNRFLGLLTLLPEHPRGE